MSTPFQDDTQTEDEIKDCRNRFEGLVAQRVALLKAREAAAKNSIEPSKPELPELPKRRSLVSRILSITGYTIIVILFLLIGAALSGLLEGIMERLLGMRPW